EVAARVYLSPSYFSRLFKAETGTTFIDYLTNYRIQKSKVLLRVTSLPIEIIANNTGFSNASYFSTTFNRIEGRTPTEYRNLLTALKNHSPASQQENKVPRD
ncbi:MAG: helix-turn-helix transcriptional regulator, partial [Alicyclobacillus herbarius]|uniref:helix-turn-helix domain-containing protein n=1 Tax=Alicyclobacillus herbarius TaxID=122960 RepID=UPI0023545767